MKRVLRIAAVALVLGALAALIMLWWTPGPKPGPHTIIIEEGSSLATVAEQLDEMGAIPGNATSFRIFARLLGSSDPIQAGEFATFGSPSRMISIFGQRFIT
ncbi:MAG: hypothetical protein ACLGHC_10565, partial [Alphaproteobacteria bacterium]